MKIDDVLESQRVPARLSLSALLFFWNGELLLSAIRGSTFSAGLLVLSLLVQGSLYWMGRRFASPRRGALLASAGAVLGLWWFGTYSVETSSPDAAAAVFCVFIATLTVGLQWALTSRIKQRVTATVIPSRALDREIGWAFATATAMMFLPWAIVLTFAALLFVTGLPNEPPALELPLFLKTAITGASMTVRLAPFAVLLALVQRSGRLLRGRVRTPLGTAMSDAEAALGVLWLPTLGLFSSILVELPDFPSAFLGALAVAAWLWMSHSFIRSVAPGEKITDPTVGPDSGQVTMEPTSLNRVEGAVDGKGVAFWASRWSGLQTLSIDGVEVSRKRSFWPVTTHDLHPNELGITKAIMRLAGGRILDLYRGVEQVATLKNPKEGVLLARAGASLGVVLVLMVALLKGNQPPTIPIEAASIQVVSIQAEGSTWRAEVNSGDRGQPLTLREGDWLKDGKVKSISTDQMMVEWSAPRNQYSGAPGYKALLRFSPPGPLPPITLSRETTWITSPLLPDGTPDYGAWLNQKYGAGVTPENNSAEPIRAAFAGLVDSGQTFWDGIPFDGGSWSQKLMQPWSETDCPKCVARLKLNEKALTALAAAVQKPRFFEPIPTGSRISRLEIPSLLPFRLAANALGARGMLRVGREDLDGAITDALAVQRLALLLDQGPYFIQGLIAVAMRGIGSPVIPAVASAPSLSASAARAFLHRLTELPPPPGLAEFVDTSERAAELDAVLARREDMAQRGAGGMAAFDHQWGYVDSGRDPIMRIRYALPSEAFDWDGALRETNKDFDLMVAVMRATSADERGRAQAAYDQKEALMATELASLWEDLRSHIRGEATELEDLAAAAGQLAQTPEGRRRLGLLLPKPSLLRAQVSANEATTQFRLGVMTVALAVHRLSAGAFPETLAELAPSLLSGPLGPSTPLPGYTLEYTFARAAAGGAGLFALAAIPEEQGSTGVRAFCVDSTGAMRQTSDGSKPRIVDGVCDGTLERTR